MADTPKEGETVTPGDSQTTVTTTSAPTQDNASAAEVEQLRKEKEQLEMERNQLRNKLSDKEKAEDDARRKQLEEDEKYRELYEKEKSEREALLDEREQEVEKAALTKAQKELLSKYSAAAVEIAETTGLSLTDDTDEAKAEFTKKMDAISEKVPKDAKVKGNNQATPTTGDALEREQLVERMKWDNPTLRKEAINKAMKTIPGIEGMRKAAGIEPAAE